MEFEQEKQTDYSEKTKIIAHLQTQLDDQKENIKREGETVFSLMLCQLFFTFPFLIKSTLVTFMGRPEASFVTLILTICVAIALIEQFIKKQVQEDENSWYYKLWNKRKNIQIFLGIKSNLEKALEKQSRFLQEPHAQQEAITYLEDNRNFVHTGNIVEYNSGLRTFENELKKKEYSEAFSLFHKLTQMIDIKYKNPYLVGEDGAMERETHLFKKHL